MSPPVFIYTFKNNYRANVILNNLCYTTEAQKTVLFRINANRDTMHTTSSDRQLYDIKRPRGARRRLCNNPPFSFSCKTAANINDYAPLSDRLLSASTIKELSHIRSCQAHKAEVLCRLHFGFSELAITGSARCTTNPRHAISLEPALMDRGSC